MEQVNQAIRKGLYPLFVAEGESWEKQTKINHNAYLAKGQRSFEESCKKNNYDLFIFGHSLDNNDKHFLSMISKGKIKRAFISTYKTKSGYDQSLANRACRLKDEREKSNNKFPLEITLFDAASANVWG